MPHLLPEMYAGAHEGKGGVDKELYGKWLCLIAPVCVAFIAACMRLLVSV